MNPNKSYEIMEGIYDSKKPVKKIEQYNDASMEILESYDTYRKAPLIDGQTIKFLLLILCLIACFKYFNQGHEEKTSTDTVVSTEEVEKISDEAHEEDLPVRYAAERSLFDLQYKADHGCIIYDYNVTTSVDDINMPQAILSLDGDVNENYVIYDLGKKYTTLTGIAGIKDTSVSTTAGEGGISFYAIDSEGNDLILPMVVNGTSTVNHLSLGCFSDPAKITVDVTGVKLLKIKVHSGGSSYTNANNDIAFGQAVLTLFDPEEL